MATEQQTEANRRNAQHSTGPRTDTGKARSAANALKHGLSADRMVVPSEDETEFERHRQALIQQFEPVGPLEIMLVEQITVSAWRLQRCRVIETRFFHQRVLDKEYKLEEYEGHEPSDALAIVYRFDAHDLSQLSRHETRIERALYRALHELEARQAARKNVILQNEPNSAGPTQK